MATATKATGERVEVYIPRGTQHDDPNFYVAINGVNYVLPKGKTSKVPPEVKYEIDRAIRAQGIQADHIDEMIAAAQERK